MLLVKSKVWANDECDLRSLEALAEARLGVVPGLCSGRW